MTTPQDPASTYPEAVALGSLAAALVAAAEGCLAGVPVTRIAAAPLLRADVPSTLPYREPLEISASSRRRRWYVRGTEPFERMCLVDGSTDDLAEVARAALGWYAGAPLEEIRRTAPFVHLTGRFEVPEPDPARLRESEWQGMRVEAAELDTPWRETYQALVEAAHAEPALRALYPFTSHWALRFSTTTRPRLTAVGPSLIAGSDGTYRVESGLGSGEPGRFTTARATVEAAVRQLPPGLGPVVYGGAAPAPGG
ncbi:DUF6193 family natural product biosynthesis protein [Streptomyces sp. NPDC012888]|uniref:DUF6193 family natural product biosynthesis protein n=1 Tax=Streptomyces sp. NPDC012888 TaxID=3364855 RepID=UPI0036C8F6AE